ncbi:MAG: VacJ family lipoprotein [Proteobacteria bacterium]|nr:VacJ family lipoprotein [Pseudomonadota bacterium]
MSFIKVCRDLAMLTMLVSMLGVLNGCATAGNLANPKDPIEGFNRAMFAFNDSVDKAVVKPVAQGYVAAVPATLRIGVSNFFGNINDVFVAVNNLLQGKVPEALSDMGRVAINSTVGLLGLIDVASDAGLEKHDEDFGQTFGRWGVADGPYVVLPILGPRTLRDAFAQVLDTKTDPISQLSRVPSRNTLLASRGISERADYLSTDKIVDEAALDRYAYIRDAYLQRRRSKIYDGNAPREVDDGAQFDLGLRYVLLQRPGTDADLATASLEAAPGVAAGQPAPAASEERQ